jgi:tetratricopeptide (TPR) repeat protein
VQSGLGLLYAHLGDRAKAIPRLEAALALAPKDLPIMDRTAEAYEALGDRSTAIQWIDKALAGGYSFDTLKHNPEMRAIFSDPHFKPSTQKTTR